MERDGDREGGRQGDSQGIKGRSNKFKLNKQYIKLYRLCDLFKKIIEKDKTKYTKIFQQLLPLCDGIYFLMLLLSETSLYPPTKKAPPSREKT